MSYADGLMSSGERIIHRNKQHPFIFIWGARWTIGAIILGTVLLWIGANLDPGGFWGAVKTALGWITFVMYVGGIVVFAWTALHYVNQEYVLTNRRVLQVEGVLNRTATDSSLEKINDAVLSQSIFGRMFDFGDLKVLTAAEAGIEDFRMIKSPIVFKKAMLDAKHEHEVEMERAGVPSAPPMNTAFVGDSATPSSIPVSPRDEDDTVAVSTALSPDEIMRTLNNLADLRDRGAITTAEYDAKKTDLLSRL
jgi:uncharacterized membrane protein YdbT with pleckstrin-like domain